MRLSELVRNIYHGDIVDSKIDNITFDSRNAGSGSVFICIKGARADGHDFAGNAYSNGCRVFVCERSLDLPDDAVQILCDSTLIFMAQLADAFYGHPQMKLKIIGITGTKGKTTVTSYIKQILTAAGYKTASIGTNGIEIGDETYPLKNTTPDSITLHRTFSEMVRGGIKYVVMEVSSQAYKLDRVYGISFDVGIFTNLSPDHISPVEHPDYEDYRRCKGRLFENSRVSILNCDDSESSYMELHSSGKIIRVSSSSSDCDYHAENISDYNSSNSMGIRFNMCGGEVEMPLKILSPGRYSVCNALLAASAAIELGVDTETIKSALGRAVVKGRFEIVEALPYATVIIDYAHNEISLESVLRAIREHMTETGRGGRLICLFGAVGGKAEMRRRGLAAASSKYSDYVILTDDNPDFEEPEKIISEVIDGFDDGFDRYKAITDREKAIRYAVDMLDKGDVLLLAGKGHETYQIVKGKKVPFEEKKIVLSEAEKILSESGEKQTVNAR